MKNNLLRILLLSILLTSCHRIDINTINQSTADLKVAKFEVKGIYPKHVIEYFVRKLKIPEKIDITSGIELFRISYYTKDEDNNKVLVSGLVAFPRNKKIKGVVSYQHGTNCERGNAPSKPSEDEGLGISAIFAGGGYLCLIPDYIGFGVSTEVHPYLHVQTTVNAVVDLLKLGSEICSNLTGDQTNNLFLTGISQGGHATAAVQRYIEKNPIDGLKLTGTSSIVGAYNLKEISIPYAIESNSVFYLGYLANAYCHIYKKPLGSIIQHPYDKMIPGLFDGNHDYDQIMKKLPRTADSLYTKDILDDFKSGKSDWLTEKLGENQSFDWKPGVKFRMYYGLKDKDVSPKDALNAYTSMKKAGGNVELICLGNLNHLETAFIALPKTRAYFDSLSIIAQK